MGMARRRFSAHSDINMWTAPDVFRYRDYRTFLKAFYGENKAKEYGFSLRAFSKRARLRSSNYLKLVMDGDRNLTAAMATRFAEACSLRAEAADYFCELVAFNQATTAAERERVYVRLGRFKQYRKIYRLDREQEAYHSSWYIPVVRELVARADFRDDARWIARTLQPKIAPREAAHALKTLTKLGLLVRDGDGRLKQNEALVQTPDGPLGHQVMRFHRAMLERAAEALDVVPREERAIESLTFCVSEARIQELKGQIDAFCEELLQTYQADEHSRRVVQVNVQMFPVTVKES